MAEPPRGRRPGDPPADLTMRAPRVVEELLGQAEPTKIVSQPDRGKGVREPRETATYADVRFGAGARPAPAVTEKMAAAIAPERARPPVPEGDKTKVWIATHKLPAEVDPRLVLARDPDGPRAASFRVLRHRLVERGDPRVIAVSSPGAREGKTTCAANLALALGECGRARVLLVEANLRNPSLAALFGFMPPECFAQQLSRHRDKPEDPWSVVEVGAPSLHVAAVKPSKETRGRPLLDGVAFGIAAAMLRRATYDYIVFDTPPVLGSADVNLVEDHADGVVLVALARTTTGRSVRRAVEQLSPGRILGLTLL